MFGMAGVFAEFERSMIVERVNAGLARARTQGKTLGRGPRASHQQTTAAGERHERSESELAVSNKPRRLSACNIEFVETVEQGELGCSAPAASVRRHDRRTVPKFGAPLS
jgi:DNA invertase Pin-like site-specific DNA recombinase